MSVQLVQLVQFDQLFLQLLLTECQQLLDIIGEKNRKQNGMPKLMLSRKIQEKQL